MSFLKSSLFLMLATLVVLLPGSTAISAPLGQDELLIDYPPNQDYGQQGDFIAKRAVDAGRSAIIGTIGPAVILLPESPGSSNAHVTLQNWDSSWDLSNPLDPQFVRYVNCFEGTCRNGQGIHAHAFHTNFGDGEAYLWTNNNWQSGDSHTYDPVSGDTVPASPAQDASRGRLYSPFYMDDLWSYGAPFDSTQTLYYSLLPGDTWRGLPLATWDHLGLTGVTGFFSFHGDLMIVASDQASSGMAIYSMNGWRAGLTSGTFTPQLLSVFQPSLSEPDGTPIGIGGYWAEPYGANKMVWAARRNDSVGRNVPAMYVVDFTDPAAPELTCELYFDQDTSDPADGDNMTHPMYVNFQDQYAYVDHMKVDISLCETLYAAGKAVDPNYIINGSEMNQVAYKFATTQNYCDGSQYFRPLGQIGVFGGYDNYGTDAIMTYEGPTIEAGSYSSGVYVSYNFGPNRAMVGANSLAPGDTLNGGRTVISIERDERVNTQGMCFFVTSDEADTNPPYVSGHRPLANQTNVARDTFISLHIPETMRSETLVDGFQLTRADTGAAVAFGHRLSHTGTVTLWPDDDLEADVTYRVGVAGIQDYMGNMMTPYSFLFATGNNLAGSTPTDTPEPAPTDTPEPAPTDTPEPAPTNMPAPEPTLEPTLGPTTEPTVEPTVEPTTEPAPTEMPTLAPTPIVTAIPTLTSTPATQAEWISCALEDETCTIPNEKGEVVVRYGANGAYAYREGVSGSIVCSKTLFGDPILGTAKSCEYWAGTAAADYAGEPYYPNQSSQLSCRPEAEGDNLWVVNPDNHSIAIIDTFLEPGSRSVALRSQREAFFNYRTPTSVTRIGDLYAVTYRDDDKVLFVQAATADPLFAIDTGHGTQPVASITDGALLFVSLFGSGEVIAIDPERRAITARLAVGPMPKAMALFENRLLVTRFISSAENGELYDIDIASGSTSGLTLTRTIVVNKVLVGDDLSHGSGVPNFLSSIAINRDGSEALITAVKANVDRGSSEARSGVALDDDNTVRPMLARIDLINNRDANIVPLSPDGTVDLDNAADPAGITFLVDGETQLVTLQGNNVVLARNERANTFTQFSSGFAPQSICTTLRTAYVKNFTGRSVSAIDVAGYLAEGSRNPAILTIDTVENELFGAQELAGLKQFYHSSVPQMGAEGYMSCASCHADGGQDGQVWDMTSLGEGLRNTISLNGGSGVRFGNLHWSANFDEVQDFELQIEALNGGDGLIEGKTFANESPLAMVTSGQSSELDALAAYVASLGKESVKRSPYRTYSGSLTDAAMRGLQLFETQGCATCHAGQAFRDGQLHDVGTITATSGNRLSGELAGIRTPTLIELWESAPYFHDGSAATVGDLLATGVHERTLSDADEADLIEFLLSIDQDLFIEDDTPYPDFE